MRIFNTSTQEPDIKGGRFKVRSPLLLVAKQDILMRVAFYASIFMVVFLAGCQVGKFIASTLL